VKQQDRFYDQILGRLKAIADNGFAMIIGLNDPRPRGAVTTYPIEWSQYYIINDLFSRDPVIQWAIANSGTLNWRDIPMSDTDKEVMETARQFGLVNGTIHAQNFLGEKVAISASHKSSELTPSEILEISAAVAALSVLTPKNPSPDSEVKLLKFLQLSSLGYTGAELEEAMSLGSSALRRVKSQAVDLLQARNLPHAVSLAKDSGLI
jgi:hypothetical protein